jgi:hypothetical protein
MPEKSTSTHDFTAIGGGSTGERAPGTQTVPSIEPL